MDTVPKGQGLQGPLCVSVGCCWQRRLNDAYLKLYTLLYLFEVWVV